ncbi:hypothetical protein E2C01_065387 [Portunus trituberculatus]|uniref:Uncharacterized protein n=1 Tax=Portunus trituberculatus TaxID=210409 RepID=A0A5B7HQZ0_PORTR|nr:hypothetical protein [Portunus trituberculatus]
MRLPHGHLHPPIAVWRSGISVANHSLPQGNYWKSGMIIAALEVVTAWPRRHATLRKEWEAHTPRRHHGLCQAPQAKPREETPRPPESEGGRCCCPAGDGRRCVCDVRWRGGREKGRRGGPGNG